MQTQIQNFQPDSGRATKLKFSLDAHLTSARRTLGQIYFQYFCPRLSTSNRQHIVVRVSKKKVTGLGWVESICVEVGSFFSVDDCIGWKHKNEFSRSAGNTLGHAVSTKHFSSIFFLRRRHCRIFFLDCRALFYSQAFPV